MRILLKRDQMVRIKTSFGKFFEQNTNLDTFSTIFYFQKHEHFDEMLSKKLIIWQELV